MNKTEQRYAEHLEALRHDRRVSWWRFEPFNLRLANNTYYRPDFAVLAASGLLEIHEVKGHWMDDARVKIKVAAEQFPFRFIAVKAKPRAEGGGWSIEEF